MREDFSCVLRHYCRLSPLVYDFAVFVLHKRAFKSVSAGRYQVDAIHRILRTLLGEHMWR